MKKLTRWIFLIILSLVVITILFCLFYPRITGAMISRGLIIPASDNLATDRESEGCYETCECYVTSCDGHILVSRQYAGNMKVVACTRGIVSCRWEDTTTHTWTEGYATALEKEDIKLVGDCEDDTKDLKPFKDITKEGYWSLWGNWGRIFRIFSR